MLLTITSGHLTILATLTGVAACASNAGRRVTGLVKSALRPVARRPVIGLVLLPLVSLAMNAAWAKYVRTPIPHVHDEFSYLLAADTFEHGRLSNPTHPMWKHLETLQVIQQPTYASKYPPAQGFSLALGHWLANREIMGVWLASAAACAAVYWMLLGWLPRSWALLGAVLAMFHPELLFWSQSYWGGSLALLGGALVVGSLPRIRDGAVGRGAIPMGIGIAILANARPFEGFMLVASVLTALLLWMLRRRWNRGVWEPSLRRTMIPLAVIVAAMFVWIGYYNWRVTDNPLKLPYVLHEQQSAVAPVFLFQNPRPQPAYQFTEIRDEHLKWELEPFLQARAAPWHYAQEKLSLALDKFQGQTGLGLVLIVLPLVVWRDRRLREAALLLLIPLAGFFASTFMKSQYVAPEAGLPLILAIGSMRWLYVWQRSRRVGQLLVFSAVLMTAVGYCSGYYDVAHPQGGLPGVPMATQRQQIVDRLDALPGKQLVLVRYSLPEDVIPEWVYNAADIDSSKIVWAHDMGAQQNRELLDYFKDRQVWSVLVSERPAELVPLGRPAPTTQPGMQYAGDRP